MTDVNSKDTSFPTAPYKDDLCFREDLGLWCQHDGVRWVTCDQYRRYQPEITISATENEADLWIGDAYAPKTSWCEMYISVDTTNDSDNYWRMLVRERDIDEAGAANAIAWETSALAADTAYSKFISAGYGINRIIPPSYGKMFYRFVKVGSPGDLTVSAVFSYRRVIP